MVSAIVLPVLSCTFIQASLKGSDKLTDNYHANNLVFLLLSTIFIL